MVIYVVIYVTIQYLYDHICLYMIRILTDAFHICLFRMGRRENRGAEGRGGCYVPSSYFLIFLAVNDAFWRILGDCL